MKTIQLTAQQIETLREMIDARQTSLTERLKLAQNQPARSSAVLDSLSYFDTIDEALKNAPEAAPAKDAEQIADENAEFSYDFHGINGNDDYRSRLATLTTEGRRLNVGPLFEQAPPLLGLCREILTSYAARMPAEFLTRLDVTVALASRKI